MTILKNGIFIQVQDIRNLTGYKEHAAGKELRTVCDALGKKFRRVTINEYCNYFQLDYEEIVNYLNHFR